MGKKAPKVKVFQVAAAGVQGRKEGDVISDDERQESPRASAEDQLPPELQEKGQGEEGEAGNTKSKTTANRRDSTQIKKQELKKAIKHKEKRLAAEDQAFEDLLIAYQKNPNPNVPPPVPPRSKKRALYKLRKCFGCAHVDIEVAIIEGDVWALRRTVKRLSRRRPAEMNQYYQDGTTPLILAIKEKREDLVDVILTSPVLSLQLKDAKTGLYPIHMAIIFGLNLSVHRMLEIPSIDLEIKDPRGMTPIMLAAMVGNLDYFMGFVNKGASLQEIDQEGMNLLICAAYGGNVNICQWLLEAGFDKDYEDKRKNRAYDWAMLNNKGPAAAAIAEFKSAIDDYDPSKARKLAAQRRV